MRTYYCGEINESSIGKTVTICGWVHYRRDLGGLIFLEIRDRTGLVQAVFSPQETAPALFKLAEQTRKEYVVCIQGEIRLRPEGTENKQLSSGKIELLASTLD